MRPHIAEWNTAFNKQMPGYCMMRLRPTERAKATAFLDFLEKFNGLYPEFRDALTNRRYKFDNIIEEHLHNLIQQTTAYRQTVKDIRYDSRVLIHQPMDVAYAEAQKITGIPMSRNLEHCSHS